MPKSRKGKRVVQCAARVKLGPFKGDRCKREKLMAVDEHSNTLGFWCHSHKNQRGVGR